ncbi:MAG: hypothetical protein IPK26_31255 [Planctomycetes bacterium]|nr:hypothetical protein [Planctomycetota bacterium]
MNALAVVVRVLTSILLAALAVAKWLPFTDGDLLLPRWSYLWIGIGEAALAVLLWTRWTRPAAALVAGLGAIGCVLAIGGFAHACGCAGALRLSLVQHYVLAAVVAGLGCSLLGCRSSSCSLVSNMKSERGPAPGVSRYGPL